MQVSIARLGLSVLGFLPLLALALWAYSPAKPYSYPDVSSLLLSNYTSAAIPEPLLGLYLRQVILVVLAVGCTLVLLRLLKHATGAMLAGVLGSLVMVQPAAVPWVLSTDSLGELLSAVVAVLSVAMLLAYWARRQPVVSAPLSAWCLLLGLGMSVQSAGDVLLRSNPPLFVLSEFSRDPDSAQAQLALGMHFLSIGGREQAIPYLRSAGRKLSKNYELNDEYQMLAITRRLANMSMNEKTEQFELSLGKKRPNE